MLPLKLLYHNADLVHMIRSYWLTNDDQDLLDRFRISANAVYPIRRDGRVCMLRFAPLTERAPDAVRAEVRYMGFLRESDLSVPAIVPNLEGDLVTCADTPWGEYVAILMERMPGVGVDGIDITADIARRMGATLGAMHAMGARYEGIGHASWEDRLDRCEALCAGEPAPIREEAAALRRELSTWVRTPGTYGVVHADFEPDNLLYDAESDRLSVIDFDDCHMHFLVYDLAVALEELDAALHGAFLEGYRAHMELDGAFYAHQRPYLLRYQALVTHARLLHSVADGGPWPHEPEWMAGLRERFAARIEAYRDGFMAEDGNAGAGDGAR